MWNVLLLLVSALVLFSLFRFILSLLIIMAEAEQADDQFEYEIDNVEVLEVEVENNESTSATQIRTRTVDEAVPQLQLPKAWSFLDEHFQCSGIEINEQDDRKTKIILRCKKCNERVASSKSSTSNYKRHLKVTLFAYIL